MNFGSVIYSLPVQCGLLSFVLAAIAFPFYIRWLKSKQIEQYVREEGPQSHAAKAKTPTMGGLCFIAVSTIVSLGFLLPQAQLQPGAVFAGIAVTVAAALCGLVGFVDDFAKVTSRSNKGMSAKSRLITEFGIGLVLGAVLMNSPITAAMPPLLQYGYCFFLVPCMVAATTNALNLHDGMDGLAAGTSIQVLFVFALIFSLTGVFDLAIVAAALLGAVAGFLIYNKNPAKVFMGDTGSLFIGGALAGLAAASGLIALFVALAFIYIIETVSVMIQVAYFKLTKDYTPETPMSKPALIWFKLTKRLPGEGKRFFRMAPLHHHFEAVGADNGVPEWQVVAYFWLTQFAICAAVLSAFLNYGPRSTA